MLPAFARFETPDAQPKTCGCRHDHNGSDNPHQPTAAPVANGSTLLSETGTVGTATTRRTMYGTYTVWKRKRERETAQRERERERERGANPYDTHRFVQSPHPTRTANRKLPKSMHGKQPWRLKKIHAYNYNYLSWKECSLQRCMDDTRTWENGECQCDSLLVVQCLHPEPHFLLFCSTALLL